MQEPGLLRHLTFVSSVKILLLIAYLITLTVLPLARRTMLMPL